jgi:hypothetical protein
MSHLKRVVTEVFFTAPGATMSSLRVTTLTSDVNVIKREAMHKAQACYGLNITNVTLGNQSFL